MVEVSDEIWELWSEVSLEVFIGRDSYLLCDGKLLADSYRKFVETASVYASELPFFILTAWNPNAQRLSSRTNHARQARLLLELSNQKVKFWPSRGWSSGWSESGTAFFAKGFDLVDRLARDFGQAGYYYIFDDHLWLVDVSRSRPALAL
ncbi:MULTISPECIES: DUF3293 domain-containing protein [Acidithrix]|uniref:DUF3293 domain-containing protein n=1 Tax=Acidithrix ferrooxidans TaxID=1280514 RepID=A0A0D8HJS0_9ACTN|nr:MULTISPECIES: DUF3293 domain-containing protein [Acidithrix]KJF18198.1 hypothetical protein AXFE_09440 [Acidithrix ferrooxidans]